MTNNPPRGERKPPSEAERRQREFECRLPDGCGAKAGEPCVTKTTGKRRIDSHADRLGQAWAAGRLPLPEWNIGAAQERLLRARHGR
jgi:hypothetical protein